MNGSGEPAPAAPFWRALLVDDERLARKRMATLLAAHPEVRMVGEAGDLSSARELMRTLQPNLVFLDIQLSLDNGFDLLPDLPADTEVIFVTAHDTFAVRAFAANALDYLLKPVLPARLAASLRRLRQPPPPGVLHAEPVRRMEAHDHLLLRDGRTWHRVAAPTVAAVVGEGAYTRLMIAGGGSILTMKTLTHWSSVLPEQGFVRLSRSLIVNLALVRRCQFVNRNHSEIHLNGRENPLRLGRVASRELRRHWRGQEPEQRKFSNHE